MCKGHRDESTFKVSYDATVFDEYGQMGGSTQTVSNYLNVYGAIQRFLNYNKDLQWLDIFNPLTFLTIALLPSNRLEENLKTWKETWLGFMSKYLMHCDKYDKWQMQWQTCRTNISYSNVIYILISNVFWLLEEARVELYIIQKWISSLAVVINNLWRKYKTTQNKPIDANK